jgi:hypothetical protein
MKSDTQQIIFVLLLLQLAPQIGARRIAAQRSQAPKIIWQGHSGGFSVRWTSMDLTVNSLQSASPALFSAYHFARQGFAQYLGALRSDPAEPHISFGKCIYERRFKLLSVVGTVLSLEDQEFSSCEKQAHPASTTRFTAIIFPKLAACSIRRMTSMLTWRAPAR